jgi:hypothetical protein
MLQTVHLRTKSKTNNSLTEARGGKSAWRSEDQNGRVISQFLKFDHGSGWPPRGQGLARNPALKW